MQNTTLFGSNSCFKKHVMWYKVKELNSKGLKKTQIARELGIHRETVRRYLSFSESEFLASQSYRRLFYRKLSSYKPFVHKELERFPYLSSAQIHDHLKETFEELPNVNPKTVYNFVESIRKEFSISKTRSGSSRVYSKIPDTPYGRDAQVDFGERWIHDSNRKPYKVYFFVMVLCRSRYKYVFMSNTPFTSALAVYAHELAFEYFGGIPKRIIYDQDKVLLSQENLGDLVLTSLFRPFVEACKFEPIFCRKQDPESKGKVENVVKYVKNNFLKGRTYIDLEHLNTACLAWLKRTGNGVKHATTYNIPSEDFHENEQAKLEPYIGRPCRPVNTIKPYLVRKDNTISYKSNYYSLPIGTYTSKGVICYVEEQEEKLIIYSQESGKVITTHKKTTGKGSFIRSTTHRGLSKNKNSDNEAKVLAYLKEKEIVSVYLTKLRKNKRRYYRDNLNYLVNHMKECTPKVLLETIAECEIEQLFNTKDLIEITTKKEYLRKIKKPEITGDINDIDFDREYNFIPEKASIETYKDIIL